MFFCGVVVVVFMLNVMVVVIVSIFIVLVSFDLIGFMFNFLMCR